MKVSSVVFLTVTAVGGLLWSAGCSGDQGAFAPGQSVEQIRQAPAGHGRAGGSWMMAEAKNEDLLYVGGNNDQLTVYSYPKGKLVGVINNADFYLLSGECADAKGDVYVTSLGNEKIFEYPHGSKKLIRTLQATTNDPADCSVDPVTGDLAVTTLGFGSSGNVAIYPHGSGSPTTYTDPNVYSYFFCGYDRNGNLFVDGQDYSLNFELTELPRGSGTFTTINLDQSLQFPGSVLWDGKYVAVGDQNAQTVYEFAIAGSSGTLERSTPINGIRYDDAFWVRSSRILVADGGGSYQSIVYFDYPAGGNSIKTITKDIAGPHGLTVSPGKK